MCVNTLGLAWERPAERNDIPVIASRFPGVNYDGFLQAMSQDGGRPLTTDLTLIGAMMNTEPDDLGMCFVPFASVDSRSKVMVKLPVMDHIVEWFENSALGTDMWQHASDFAEAQYGGRFHFAMNCGCGFVARKAKSEGHWALWQQRFNASRYDLYGRTKVVRREHNDLSDLDMTTAQLTTWLLVKSTLESLAAGEGNRVLRAA